MIISILLCLKIQMYYMYMCNHFWWFNPILTGLFESKFLLGGGSIWPPLQISAPKGADRREILHGCEDTSKEYCYREKNAENGLFIILL